MKKLISAHFVAIIALVALNNTPSAQAARRMNVPYSFGAQPRVFRAQPQVVNQRAARALRMAIRRARAEAWAPHPLAQARHEWLQRPQPPAPDINLTAYRQPRASSLLREARREWLEQQQPASQLKASSLLREARHEWLQQQQLAGQPPAPDINLTAYRQPGDLSLLREAQYMWQQQPELTRRPRFLVRPLTEPFDPPAWTNTFSGSWTRPGQ